MSLAIRHRHGAYDALVYVFCDCASWCGDAYHPNGNVHDEGQGVCVLLMNRHARDEDGFFRAHDTPYDLYYAYARAHHHNAASFFHAFLLKYAA